MEQKFAINQKVWTLQWDLNAGEDRREVDMPYKILESRIVGVHGSNDRVDVNGNFLPSIRYSLANEIGRDEIPNNMDMFHALRRDWGESQIYDSYDAAALAIIRKIDDRTDFLEEMKSEYLNLLKEHKKEKQLIDDELFQLGD